MYHAGYCIFSVDPGEYTSITCRVCGTECNVDHNVRGPHSYAESLAKAYSGGKAEMSVKDVFSCPHAEEEWHEKACNLAREKTETRSDRVKSMIQADIDDLVLLYLLI